MSGKHPMIREGLTAGAIGAASVAIWFLILDALKGQIFFTPAALGSALFFGASGIDEVHVTAGVLAGYTLLHVVAFMIVGLVAARLMTGADEEPRILLGVGVAFVTAEVAMLCMLQLFASWLLEALPLWTVLVANVIAAVAMGVYLNHVHPGAARNFRTNLEERDLAP